MFVSWEDHMHNYQMSPKNSFHNVIPKISVHSRFTSQGPYASGFLPLEIIPVHCCTLTPPTSHHNGDDVEMSQLSTNSTIVQGQCFMFDIDVDMLRPRLVKTVKFPMSSFLRPFNSACCGSRVGAGCLAENYNLHPTIVFISTCVICWSFEACLCYMLQYTLASLIIYVLTCKETEPKTCSKLESQSL
ncbi:hypothetical protein BU24DRAFT_204720 [Aaosphaeria arxii CBS 175.79]|uniref:Uncharacterized protein n=1 Tax=Aaosphaeria arxii CBS 175.79 TaxID=1450172 RepID=A0A6A5XTE2_9PLEO|nr:uncharacterized protein BU24DRAFT_204720 [Aaosphaeria arxii CBS 175.79]KAF2016558.1 hypothetical protein BU24DRAFT_204720 [Aaosphaeria arxii CBS 175.79]